jgi:hypothetical protein
LEVYSPLVLWGKKGIPVKALVIAILLVVPAANLPAQTPSAAAQSQKPSPVLRPPDSDPGESKAAATYEAGFLKTDFGFTSRYPTDWQNLTAILPSQLTKELKKLEGEKDPAYMLAHRQLECRQPVLLLRHGSPPSVISVIAFPHSCTKLEESGFAAAALGMCSITSTNYDVSDALQGAYKLGDATLVIERAVGTSKDHPEVKVTLERVCGWLKNAEVFWQGELRDEEAVKVFEGALTSIGGEAPSPLVPASVIAKLHRPYAMQRSPHLPLNKSTAASSVH